MRKIDLRDLLLLIERCGEIQRGERQEIPRDQRLRKGNDDSATIEKDNDMESQGHHGGLREDDTR